MVYKLKFASSSSTSYNHNVLLMDLDAHNYAHSFLCADDNEAASLVDTVTVELRPFILNVTLRQQEVTKDLLVSGFEKELLSSMFSCLRNRC
jgi:hypothetical protein